jgi:hypothetical protein
LADIRQPAESSNARSFASGLAPQRRVGDLRQFRVVLADRRHSITAINSLGMLVKPCASSLGHHA